MSDSQDARVREVVAELLGLDADRVTDDLSRDDDAGWDSMTHLRLVSAVEQELEVRLTMEEVGRIRSVADLVAAVRARGAT